MLNLLEKVLYQFRPCFSRQAAFFWFLIVMVGFLVRLDHQGVSSFVRWLFLDPACYDPLLHFFRTSSWSIGGLVSRWVTIALNHYPVIEFNDRILLVGDGIKVCKEARRMPAVKRLHQDSDNSGKGEYIYGHHFGYVGLLVGYLAKAFCLPLHGELHEGVGVVRPAQGIGHKPPTIVTRMAHLVLQTAVQSGRLCYVALDAYFAVGPTFLIFSAAVNEKREQWVHVITRAKDNYVAYLDREFSPQKFHEDNKVKLTEYFGFPEFFEQVTLDLYGHARTIEYFCIDLIWKPINDYVRFVCVRDGEGTYVLMSSDIHLSPLEIIKIYSYRAKIEVMFLFLKHLIGGFCYRFWTKSLSKLKRKREAQIDQSTLSNSALARMDTTVEAIERFVNLAGIALGLLQYLALKQASGIWASYTGWLRTYSSQFPSEQVVQRALQAEFFSPSEKVPISATLRLIRDRARKSRPESSPPAQPDP